MPDLSFLAAHDLAVYSEASCPDCVRLKRWVTQHDVRVKEILLEQHPEAAEKLERETGKMAVPFILVDGRTWVRGYHREHPTRFSEELLLSELRAAIGS